MDRSFVRRSFRMKEEDETLQSSCSRQLDWRNLCKNEAPLFVRVNCRRNLGSNGVVQRREIENRGADVGKGASMANHRMVD